MESAPPSPAEMFWSDIPESFETFFVKIIPWNIVEIVVSSGKDLSLEDRLQLLAYAVEADIEYRRISTGSDDPYHDPASQGAALHLLASIKDYQNDGNAVEEVYRRLLVGDDALDPDLKILLDLAMIEAERARGSNLEANFWALVPLLREQIDRRGCYAMGGLRALMRCVLNSDQLEEAEGQAASNQAELVHEAAQECPAEQYVHPGGNIHEKLSRLRWKFVPLAMF